VIRQFEKIEQHLFASQGYLNEFGELKTLSNWLSIKS